MFRVKMSKYKKLISVILTVAAGSVAIYTVRKKYKTVKKSMSADQTDAQVHKQGIYEKYVKRPQDFCCALAAIIVLSPVMAVTALLVRIKLGTPVLFKQERATIHGRRFYVYKLRTMKENVENYSAKKDDDRITKPGKFLRRTRIDELPQLINILKGEMSFIGPRPVVEDELEKYGPNKAKFLSVKPGLTGYWASHGRSSTSYEDRMKLELYYVDHASLWMDIKIFFKTFSVILTHEGAW